MNKIILTTGGTGGHIFPAKVMADKIRDYSPVIISDKNYLKFSSKKDNLKFRIINSPKLKSSNIINIIKFIAKLSISIIISFYFLLKTRGKLVIGFGGYATFSILLTAVILRKKIILHEQNAYIGKVNRIFLPFAHHLLTSYEKTFGIKKKHQKKIIFIGNPIRDKIINLSKIPYKLDDYSFNILILGGSGGAKFFSEKIPEALYNVSKKINKKINIIQQAKIEDLENLKKRYKNYNMEANINYFFQDVEKLLKNSHLIISRSGSVIFEFFAAKKPSILIPFELSSDNHQNHNAQFAKKKKSAIVFDENNFDSRLLQKTIEFLVTNPKKLIQMSDNAFDAAQLNSSIKFKKIIKEII